MIQDKWMRRNYKVKLKRAVEHLGGKCVDCGSTESLEFDHDNPETKAFNITQKTRLSWKRLVLEIDKCKLRCKVCHKKKTMLTITPAQHGSMNMYTVYKCRCDLCKENWNKASRRWKAARKQRLVVQR